MRGPAPHSPQSLGWRLIHAARALEASGSYNAAKLLWALAYSEEIRGSAAAGEPVTRAERDRELQALIPALRAAGTGEAILSAIERGRLAALEDRTIPLEEIPPVYVCRTCGQVALSRPPERCPACGARPLSWREFRRSTSSSPCARTRRWRA